MKPREFHIWDFPTERVRVLFKNHQRFLNETITYFGSRKKLAGFLSVSPQMVYSWKKHNLFIPLLYIRKIVKFRSLDWNLIEKEVLAYKGPNLSLVVKNPKLPIKESPALFEIIAHLIADGSVNKNRIPMYINSNKNLIDNFDKLIGNVFGDIDAKLYQREDGCYNYTTSKIVADLLYHFYPNIDFDSLTARFPPHTLQLPKEYPIAIIRAITDDEGSIRDGSIAIKMKNKILVDRIKEMMMYLFGKNSVYDVMLSDLGMREVHVRSGYLSVFQKKIRLVHPQKQHDLAQALRRIEYRKKRHRGSRWESKMNILRLLSIKNYTIKGLSERLLIRNSNLYYYIRDLQEEKFVRKTESVHNPYFYILTKQGHSFLGDNDFQKERKKIVLNTLFF